MLPYRRPGYYGIESSLNTTTQENAANKTKKKNGGLAKRVKPLILQDLEAISIFGFWFEGSKNAADYQPFPYETHMQHIDVDCSKHTHTH